jgi:hypothetical protein
MNNCATHRPYGTCELTILGGVDNVKKCKVYNHTNTFEHSDRIELDAVIIDKKVLFPMSRIINKEPTHIIDEQYYYPLREAEKFPERFDYKYFPFSVICEWDEFMDFSDESKVSYPDWVAHYVNWLGYEMGDLNITEEKWGYCDIYTGEVVIPPQWDWCDDFGSEGYAIVKGMGYYGVIDEYGEVCIYPDYNSICNVDIKRAEGEDGVFFVKNEVTGKWGAMDVRYEFEQELLDVGYKWDYIWWDGRGGYTVVEIAEDGRKLYGIVNKRDKIVIQNLTRKPVRYSVPVWETRQNTYRDGGQGVSFRIISNDDKYGLVVDVPDDTESSKLLLEPAHTYEYVLEAAAKEDMEWEIHHYAWLIAKTPIHVADAWENVPQDIVEDVRQYTKSHDLEQGSRVW